MPEAPGLTESELGGQASRVWDALAPGSVVWLEGDLGSGKTTFVRYLVQAAGGDRATSPTFALVHEYETPHGLVVHVDCYRLREPDEAIDLDFPDLADRARALLIEWPERAGRHAPRADLLVRFAYGADATRRHVEVGAP